MIGSIDLTDESNIWTELIYNTFVQIKPKINYSSYGRALCFCHAAANLLDKIRATDLWIWRFRLASLLPKRSQPMMSLRTATSTRRISTCREEMSKGVGPKQSWRETVVHVDVPDPVLSFRSPTGSYILMAPRHSTQKSLSKNRRPGRASF